MSRNRTSRVEVCFNQSKSIKPRGLLSFLSMEAKDLNKSFGWFLPAVAISSNALVLYLIVAKQRLCKKPYWFILSLTTADFLLGLRTYYFVCYRLFTRKDRCWTCNSNVHHFAFTRLLLIWK